ncbi:hypothetical protein HELRODRAFT_183686 [Helobdella robusta]|uniref:Uncharacterized protein n=1 Tax=Helobdella robusta TaxID=6412 RepID=T1FK13_HELRO|nr:hypothetical protein HELRODRAFT_183686 [Helobdella robusta]ESO10361.1 hypothetical protein HELRODRAFT_183686 [Helobdella robusta]
MSTISMERPISDPVFKVPSQIFQERTFDFPNIPLLLRTFLILSLLDHLRRDKLIACITVFNHLKVENCLDKCPMFASVNLTKIPHFKNVIKLNFNTLREEIKDMISRQQNKMLQRLDVHSIEISTLNEKINKLPFNNSVWAPSKMKKCSTPSESEISLQKPSVSKPWVGIPISQLSNSDKDVKIESNSNLDSVSHVDKIEFPSLIQDSNNNMNSGAEDSDAGFQNVTIRRRDTKRPQVNSLPQANKIKHKKTNISRVVGTLADSEIFSSKLKGIEKRCVLYLGKIAPCFKEDVEEHLSNFNIDFITVNPTGSKKISNISAKVSENSKKLCDNSSNITVDPNGTIKTSDQSSENSSVLSSAFKICILESQKDKFFNSDIWPRHAIVRDWIFKTKDNNSVNHG